MGAQHGCQQHACCSQRDAEVAEDEDLWHADASDVDDGMTSLSKHATARPASSPRKPPAASALEAGAQATLGQDRAAPAVTMPYATRKGSTAQPGGPHSASSLQRAPTWTRVAAQPGAPPAQSFSTLRRAPTWTSAPRSGEVHRWATQARTQGSSTPATQGTLTPAASQGFGHSLAAPAAQPWQSSPAASAKTPAREAMERESPRQASDVPSAESPGSKGAQRRASGQTSRPGGRSYLTTAEIKERLKQKELQPESPQSQYRAVSPRAVSPRNRGRADGSLGKVYGELPIARSGFGEAGARQGSPPPTRVEAQACAQRAASFSSVPKMTIRRQGSWVMRTSTSKSEIEALPQRAAVAAPTGSQTASLSPPRRVSAVMTPTGVGAGPSTPKAESKNEGERATPSVEGTPPKFVTVRSMEGKVSSVTIKVAG